MKAATRNFLQEAIYLRLRWSFDEFRSQLLEILSSAKPLRHWSVGYLKPEISCLIEACDNWFYHLLCLKFTKNGHILINIPGKLKEQTAKNTQHPTLNTRHSQFCHIYFNLKFKMIRFPSCVSVRRPIGRFGFWIWKISTTRNSDTRTSDSDFMKHPSCQWMSAVKFTRNNSMAILIQERSLPALYFLGGCRRWSFWSNTVRRNLS